MATNSSIPGSVYCRPGGDRIYIKLHGYSFSTGLKDSPANRDVAHRMMERLYYEFHSQEHRVPGSTPTERLRNFMDAQSSAQSPSTTTLDLVFRQFLRQVGAARRDKTVQGYVHAYQLFFDGKTDFAINEYVPNHGENTVAMLRIEQIIQSKILARVRSDSTLSIYLRTIRVFTRWAVSEGYLPEDIRYTRLKRMIGTVTTKPIETWSESELQALFVAADNRWPLFGQLVRFLDRTGLRIHEALELRWSDIDEANRMIIVERKDGKITQYLPLTSHMAGIIAQIRSMHDHQELVFGWQKKSVNRLRHWLDEACQSAGVVRRGRSFHTFRKTYITRLVQRIGTDLDAFTVAKLARARVEVIQNHYLLMPVDKLRLALEAL